MTMEFEFSTGFAETLGRNALQEIQLRRFQLLLDEVLDSNAFYRAKLGRAGIRSSTGVRTMDDLKRIPFTTKQELATDQISNPPYGTNLTSPRTRYTRIHQTSGTTGEPLRCLDTEDSWRWWARCWSAGVPQRRRHLDGPYLLRLLLRAVHRLLERLRGARLIGALAFPGGGMSSCSASRRSWSTTSRCWCAPRPTPSTSPRWPRRRGSTWRNSGVRVAIHAGEPGAGIPATRARIEEAWGARRLRPCRCHRGRRLGFRVATAERALRQRGGVPRRGDRSCDR